MEQDSLGQEAQEQQRVELSERIKAYFGSLSLILVQILI